MLNIKDFKLIDLTHALTTDIPHWDIGCGFNSSITQDYSEHHFRVQKLELFAGIGTHMDAPAHYVANSGTIDQIPLEKLIAPAIVIDISEKSFANYVVSPQDILNFENNYGKIAAQSCVLIYTGWSRYWNQPQKYRNDLIFPRLARETAEILLERDIVGLGVDTLSPDTSDDGFPVHELILGAGKYLIENIANANQLPPIRSYIFALPLKIRNGTEAPIRLIALI